MFRYFGVLLVISVVIYIPVNCTDDVSFEEVSKNGSPVIKFENVSEDLIDRMFSNNSSSECDCGDHGKCEVVGNTMECKCDDMYALKSSKCEYCDCGPKSTKCSFSSKGEKICQCQEDYASKSAIWSSYGTWCEICICGDHGRCRWRGNEKMCDCEDKYRYSAFDDKCRECNCGPHGICNLNEYGEKNCSCDFGYAEKDGYCQVCDCQPLFTRRFPGVICKFENRRKQCICPPGLKKSENYCNDINECYESNPCPGSTDCINKLGSFDCRCKAGFEPFNSLSDPKLVGCKDIDECNDVPCKSPLTRCVNSPGSYDCVCKDGYYATAGTYGNSYKPAHNSCYEKATQWREATIALGVIFAIIVIGMTCYIKKHKSGSCGFA